MDWLRKEYAKLNFTSFPSFSRGEVLAAISEMLVTRYSEEELNQLGDLSRVTTDEGWRTFLLQQSDLDERETGIGKLG